MTEKVIYLETVDPLEFYGPSNSRINLVVRHFPKLKIVARGTELKAYGSKKELENFEEKVMLLITYLQKYNSLTKDIIERILTEGEENFVQSDNGSDDVLVYGNYGKIVKPRTVNQKKMVDDTKKNDLVLAVGPAGSGKTYTAIALAVSALKNKEVKKIILSRPAVEAGEQLGYLPGDLKEKLDPYLQPLYDALWDMIPPKRLADYFEDGVIEIAPLGFMRGRTLENAFVILDEAQNATGNQFKMFLTRMGVHSKFIVTGDITQIDLPNINQSGLLQAMKILDNIKGISIVQFGEQDIVRHSLVKNIVNAYKKKDSKN